MFAKSFFPKTYYAGRYFPPVADGSVEPPDTSVWNYRVFMRVRRR
jgi:hypothetical protein